MDEGGFEHGSHPMAVAASVEGKTQRGFTLVELLVSIGILTFIIGIGTTLFTSLTGQYEKASSVTDLQREGERMMEQISRGVRNASAISGGGSSITLTIPDDTDNLEYSGNGQCTQVQFVHDATVIRKVTTAASCSSTPSCPSPGCALNYEAIAVVSAAAFTVTPQTNAPDEVAVSFTLQSAAPEAGSVSTVEFRKTILTRNY